MTFLQGLPGLWAVHNMWMSSGGVHILSTVWQVTQRHARLLLNSGRGLFGTGAIHPATAECPPWFDGGDQVANPSNVKRPSATVFRSYGVRGHTSGGEQ